MQLYRKRPVVIEAVQWTGANSTEIAEFMATKVEDITDERISGGRGLIAISTLEGVMIATPRDWIIKGIQGEFYPCKPDIFEASYEPLVNHAS